MINILLLLKLNSEYKFDLILQYNLHNKKDKSEIQNIQNVLKKAFDDIHFAQIELLY